jgi:hypothetical protein
VGSLGSLLEAEKIFGLSDGKSVEGQGARWELGKEIEQEQTEATEVSWESGKRRQGRGLLRIRAVQFLMLIRFMAFLLRRRVLGVAYFNGVGQGVEKGRGSNLMFEVGGCEMPWEESYVRQRSCIRFSRFYFRRLSGERALVSGLSRERVNHLKKQSSGI